MTHRFLYLSECPTPLLGRDLLTKLGAQITFAPGTLRSLTLGRGGTLTAVTIPRVDEWCLYCPVKEQVKPMSLLEQFPAV